ncbi:MAG: GNAT family N-acetyltransferase [Hyphomicrobiales bacterium]|nr:GNAT family N-acetyltransferase [Hyphomicrobiales bacterium]MCP4998110.1 GNAT family N-acetyltransferase [Hyphomicrobiales bacterium]
MYPRPLSGAVVATLPPALIPPRTPLAGELVTLEPQNASRHAHEMFDAAHHGEEAVRLWDYMKYGPWPDVAAYAATLRQQSASFDTIFYAIREHASGKASGQASFLDIHPADGVIEIGHIWFSPKLQRTRAATEALFLMLCHAMNDLGYRRMQWRCNALNAKSRNAARRLGFRFEGIFYNNLIFKGMNRDTAWYSILDDEWPEIRDLIAGWLAPGNFDEDGNARSSLSAAMDSRPARNRQVG